ncbi:MAG: AAA family ATPase [Candidatus Sericytochromatia bacterium]
MIPVSLNLNNFMSYKSLNIDFTEIHVACLSGENGAGKSTILDAITWCIWNESRATHSDDLIKLGESELSAELVFDIDFQRYKIIRNSKKTGKKKVTAQSNVELQILAEKGYKSITGKSSTETNKRILDIVKMNYDTFVNSAFILQGKADAFTTKKPTERKKLLADILNLEQYKNLEEKTKKKLKTYQDEKKLIERENEHNRTKIQDEESIKILLENYEQELNKNNIELLAIDKTLNSLNTEKQDINVKLSTLEQFIIQLKDYEQSFTKNQGKISNLERNLETYKTYISRKDEIESNFKKLRDLKEQENILSEKLLIYIDVNKDINLINKEIQDEKHKLELKLTDLNSKIKRLEEDKINSEKTLKDEEKILKVYDELKQLKEKQNEYNERGVKFTKLNDKKLYIEKKLNDELNKLKLEEASFKVKIKEREDKVKNKRKYEEQKKDLEEKIKELEKKSIYIEDVKKRGFEIAAIIKNNEQIIKNKKDETLLYQEKINKWLEVHDANCPMCNTHVNEEEKQTIIKKYQNDLEVIESEIDKLNGENNSLNKQNEEYRRKFQELKLEINQYINTPKEIGEIEKNISDILQSEKELITLKKELNNISEKINKLNFSPELQKELADINNEINILEFNPETISSLQSQVNKLSYIEIKYSQIETEKKNLTKIDKELPNLISERENININIHENTFAKDKIDYIRILEEKIKDLNYKDSEHSEIKLTINSLIKYEDENNKLQRSIDLIETNKEQINSLREDNIRINNFIQNYKEETKDLSIFEAKLKNINESINTITDNKNILLKNNDIVKDNISKNTEKLNFINILKKEIQESLEKFKFLDKEIDLHKELVNAFSKDGIQSIIIENAIPEIENYANQLITQMTEGRMNIKFSTIKANRSNDNISETLDIYISDELGTRNYEMYSGGEAFRVNFAIRLALSKMLAKRSGTKLKTLVIDEGFGTQDSKGISKLIEAINLVKRDFEKIIIITHINDLKEAFNNRIEVYKTIHGSEVRVIT